jgi:hypothetical protein
VPPAVDDEARSADDVHDLVAERLSGDLAGGQQGVSAEDQRRADPAGNLDRKFNGGQAASLRST